MLPTHRPANAAGEDGFTLVEVIVSIGIISVVMLGMTSFFTVSLRVNHQQGDRQVAVQVADGAMEKVRAVQVSALLTGRDAQSTADQLTAARDQTGASYVPNIDTVLLGGTIPVGAAVTGITAPLPTTPVPVSVAGNTYNQSWFLENCYRPSDDPRYSAVKPMTCNKAPSVNPAAPDTPYYHVVVAVTWKDRICGSSGLCSYFLETLVGTKSDEPVFNTATPQISPPGDMLSDVGTAVSYTFRATGGAGGNSWTFTGLPSGLGPATSTTGVITGTPKTAGSYTVSVVVVDKNGVKDSIILTWTVYPALTFANPGPISTPGGVAYTRTFTAGFGTQSYQWTATLPAGLKIDKDTGTVSGTPTAAGAFPATVTVTDSASATVSQTFTWTVPALAVTKPANQVSVSDTPITPVQLAATGGIQPYTWAATGLPDGLVLDAVTGAISGTPTTKALYVVTFTVTDASGATATGTATWNVQ
ncbi:putative Ig domain-containing protein [Actinoplanes sp. KI2]|uniref:putative Ig domain-containing protein n=1 Tax=Actinoplanes sp. KI2 TaxID=2983315 RepID=UPI0021D5F821|nr:putative Ig domain-containing protein [Actinoplanes sp. KI2]MCU7729268.1 putative Ig domain-containing protein [Actinoplanes sp. KI2]